MGVTVPGLWDDSARWQWHTGHFIPSLVMPMGYRRVELQKTNVILGDSVG